MLNTNEAIVILAHGSRKKVVEEEFLKLVNLIKKRLPSFRIEPALFQFSKRNLPMAFKKLSSEGYKKVKVVPLFLFRGVHIEDDIPAAISEEKNKYPELEISASGTLLPDERILDIVVDRIKGEHSLREFLKPEEIERKSFEIIEKELGNLNVSGGEKEVIKRVAHAAADIEFAKGIIFHPDALKKGVLALKSGSDIVTDVEMVKAGIRKKELETSGNKIYCFLNDEKVIKDAKLKNLPRAVLAMRYAIHHINEGIVVIGNAPTALFELVELIREEKVSPALVIGIPVGFVGAEESKNALRRLSVPHITNEEKRGGSAAATAVINAIIKLAINS